jgi:hypothetical protein
MLAPVAGTTSASAAMPGIAVPEAVKKPAPAAEKVHWRKKWHKHRRHARYWRYRYAYRPYYPPVYYYYSPYYYRPYYPYGHVYYYKVRRHRPHFSISIGF